MRTLARVAGAVCATVALAAGTGMAGSASAEPSQQGVVAMPPQQTPVAATTMPFPYVYQNLYIPAYGLAWDYYVYFTAAQARTIRDTGIVPAFAGSRLPYNGLAQNLLEKGRLDKVVAANGCLHIGINRTEKYSPVTKRRIAWFAWTIYAPKDIPVFCR